MKVVVFCGGLGLRMQEAGPSIPKPMVPIGNRPILWHIMRYYAHHEHADFVLCLGHKADVIKDYFLNYNEALANDFVLAGGPDGHREVQLLASDIQDWRVTFVNTGLKSSVGERLKAVRHHLDGEDLFLATYGDAVTDAPLNDLISDFVARDKIACFLCVRPTTYSFHTVKFGADQLVKKIQGVAASDMWINGGFFIFRNEIFDFIEDGDDLIAEPFQRLIDMEELIVYPYEGFWAPMDTLKDKHNLEALVERGRPPWEVWETATGASAIGVTVSSR